MPNLQISAYGLIVIDFLFLALVIAAAVLLISKTPDTLDKEIIKLRFASVTFTGIMAVFVFTAVLYFAARDKSAKTFSRKL